MPSIYSLWPVTFLCLVWWDYFSLSLFHWHYCLSTGSPLICFSLSFLRLCSSLSLSLHLSVWVLCRVSAWCYVVDRVSRNKLCNLSLCACIYCWFTVLAVRGAICNLFLSCFKVVIFFLLFFLSAHEGSCFCTEKQWHLHCACFIWISFIYSTDSPVLVFSPFIAMLWLENDPWKCEIWNR